MDFPETVLKDYKLTNDEMNNVLEIAQECLTSEQIDTKSKVLDYITEHQVSPRAGLLAAYYIGARTP